LATSSKKIALRLVGILLFLLASLFLTAIGFYFSWTQVHSPNWTKGVAVLLLLPYATVNVIFHSVTGPQPLSTPVYQASFVLGTILQLFYYYATFRLLRRLFSALTHTLRSTARERKK
jgi:nucleoside permease NupC